MTKKTTLPLAVIALACLGALGLVAVRPTVSPEPSSRRPPVVETLEAKPRDVRIRVWAHGSVEPRTESDVVAEVSGRIEWVSPSLVAGGFVHEGEPLLRIEAGDFEVGVARAQAGLARATSRLQLADADLRRLDSLSRSGVVSPADLDDAKSARAVAQADLLEAEAALAQARRDLARTEVRSPYLGRVRTKHVDLGQYVTRGAPIGRLYAVDYAEVRLPIPDEEAAFLDLPIGYRGEPGEAAGPAVTLHAEFAGRRHTWSARIVRTEGELDARTRMIHAVARVDDPYGRGDDPDRPPLAVGLFVEAEIEGRVFEDVVALPRKALRGGQDEIVVVDAEGRLARRTVDVLRRERDRVLIRAGVAPGERVCLTSPRVAVDGMQVESVAITPPDAGATVLARAETAP